MLNIEHATVFERIAFDFGIVVLFAGALGFLVTSVIGLCNKLLGRNVSYESNIKETKPKGVPKKVFLANRMREEAGLESDNSAQTKIYHNSYKLVVDKGGPNEKTIGQVQLLVHNLAVQPRHYTRGLIEKLNKKVYTGDTVLTFLDPRGRYDREISLREFLDLKRVTTNTYDMEFILFPVGLFLAVRKITQYLLKSDQLRDVLKAKPSVRLDIIQRSLDRSGESVTRQTMFSNTVDHVPELTTEGYRNKELLKYQMQTEVGMCGAPLCIAENRFYGGRCYLGFHVAGMPGLFNRSGFSQILVYEDAMFAMKTLLVADDAFEDDLERRNIVLDDVTCEEQSGLDQKLTKGSFTLLGKVAIPVRLNMNSKLKLSPIGQREVFGPNPQRPAVLKPIYMNGEKVFPLLRGLEAYTTPVEYRPLVNANAIVALATKPFREATKDDWKGLLSKEEAVKGVEGLKLRAISRTTSPGYPYIMTTKNGKKDFFGDGDYDFTGPECAELFERVDSIVEAAKDNCRLSHVFMDFLKDEVRPHAKVDAGVTRVISACPVDYVIAFRMYFGAFMAAMFRHHTVSGMCPGINPYGDWWLLASNLSQHGPRVFDGDFKRFDASEQPYILSLILEFVNRWYDDGLENARVRSVLWLDLINSRHIGGDGTDQRYIYQWSKSLPSGHPFTTPVNSLYSLITLTACYVAATGDLVNMHSHVYLATFGDDNIVNVSETVSDVFNQVTVAHYMQELFGLTYTAGSKGVDLLPYTTLEECTFLKRSFKRDELGSNGWVAPLDKASFLYRAYYYKNNRDIKSEVKENLEGMLGELALHDQEMWDEYFPITLAVMSESGMSPDFEDREGYRDYMKSRVDAWF
jgi:hypothetical protein